MASTLREHQLAMLELLKALDGVCRRSGISYQLFAGTALGAVRHGGFIPWDDDLDVILLRSEYERFLDAAERELDPERFFVQREFSAHWPVHYSKLRLQNTACMEQYVPRDAAMHQGIYIDVFPCDNLADAALLAKAQFLASKVVIAKSLDRRGYLTRSRKKKLALFLSRLLPLKPFLRLVQYRNGEGSARVHSFLGASSRYDHAVYRREWLERTTERAFEGERFPVSTDFDAFLTTLYGDYRTPPRQEEIACKRHAFLVDTEHSYTEYAHARDGVVFETLTRSIR